MQSGGLMTTMLADTGGSFWLPPQASTIAPISDFWFNFILWLSIFFFFVTLIAPMVYFAVRYRRRGAPEPIHTATHNTAMELTWTIIPMILVVFMFWGGFSAFIDSRTAPEDAYQINVLGQQWNWTFEYPNQMSHSELHVPVNRPVKLVMRSNDVLHSMFIPAFREKMDVIPGRYTTLWFKSTKPGTYPIYCAEYCGTSHSDMTTIAVVHPEGEYETWLENADPLKKMTPEQYVEYTKDPEKFIKDHPELKGLDAPVKMGEKLYAKRGCAQCHSLDGKAGVGPSWKGIWGKQEQTNLGQKLVDENYVRQSIVDPGAVIVAGFQNQMPKMPLKEREIDSLIAFIRSLGEKK